MISIVCKVCSTALRVNGELNEVETLVGQTSEYWPNRYPCFRCNAFAEGFLTPEVSHTVWSVVEVFDVTAQEAFAALHGMGIPAERNCCSDVILPLLQAVGVKARGRDVRGQQRFILNELELPDGTKLHLAPSPEGPLVYRITKPHSYVKANDVG